MKKLLPALLIALLLLSGCGGAGSDSATAEFAPTENGAVYNTAADDAGWAEETEAKYESTGSQSTALANTKMIYSADLTLETKEFDAATQNLDHIVASLGGYYENRSLNQGGSYRSLNCTVRVPVENFSAFLSQTGEIAHVTNCSEYADDVSEAYYDTEARLTTQRTKLERLQNLLEQAATMEDIIDLESAISETELQIEYLTGNLRKYDSLISYSTITVYLREVYRLSSDEEAPLTFGQRLSAALSTGLERGLDGLEDLVIGIARNWMSLLILLVIIFAAVTVFLRRRKRKKLPKAPEKPAAGDSEVK